jgi:hypothetical protein
VRLSVALSDECAPDLQLAGADGSRALMPPAHASNPSIVFFDSSGAIKLRLAVDSTGVSIRIFGASSATPIKIFEADGKEVSAPK